ncbi:MAG: amidohydrolase family protein [Lachnoclostridium sp.]|nr:amidohydrolase family protein [Lachnospira sp.]MCM1248233.1 amidohydrolase family protein [Lachnoclostridium sp.]MCM1534979.1 amidohydrolase family protein [Clostridium sp.]
MKKLIKNVNVFDGRSDSVLEHQNIVISDNLVTEIFAGDFSEEGFDEVTDGKGQYAIPGLTDAHVHLGKTHIDGASPSYDAIVGAVVAGKLLNHGITTVRDAGSMTDGLKRAIDEGVIPGPRIYPSMNYLSQTCGHGDCEEAHANRDIQYRSPRGVALCDGVAECRRAVREQFFLGASQIKIMAGGGMSSACDPVETLQFSLEEMKAIVETAADYGSYVLAHLYTPKCIQRAVQAGVKSLEHGHWIDEETAKMMKDAEVFLNPCPQFTLEEVKWNHMGEFSDQPSQLKKKKKKGGARIKEHIEETTELIHKYDLKILFGTDLMIMYNEYEPRESMDFTVYKKRFGSYKGLLAATGNFNDITKLTTYQNPYPDGEIGVLKKGSYADIVITNGNPVEDLDILGNTENILFVMKDGKAYKNKL